MNAPILRVVESAPAEAPPAPPTYWTVELAARDLSMSREGLRAKLRRSNLPPGIVVKWKRSTMLHRQRLLDWIDAQGQMVSG